MTDDPLAGIRAVAAKYDGQDNEAERLTDGAAKRLAYRRRHSGKQCDRCREIKPVSEFGRDSREPDGLLRKCRACVSVYNADRPSRRVNALDS